MLHSLKIIIEKVLFFSVNRCGPSIKSNAEGMCSTVCLFIHANCQSITQRLKFERKRENVLLNVDLRGQNKWWEESEKPLRHDSVTL